MTTETTKTMTTKTATTTTKFKQQQQEPQQQQQQKQYLSSQTMLIQFKATPKQIKLQKRGLSHLKAFEKIFQMRLSSFL